MSITEVEAKNQADTLKREKSVEKNNKGADASQDADAKTKSCKNNKEIVFMSKKEIKIDQLTRSNKVLIRSEINADHLERFKEDRTRGDIFPPVQAVYDGENYWLYDGNHRVQAELENGNTSIWVDITEGTYRDAMLLSLGANADHGVGRSNQDKRNAVTKCLRDEEWGQWSAGVIADICRVSQAFVSKLRKESTQNGFELPSATRGKDGKIRNTDKIGKKKETEPVVLGEVTDSADDLEGDTSGEEIIEEDENLEPESEDQEDQDLIEDISEDDLDIDDAESDLENDSSLEKETEPEVDCDDSNGLDNRSFEDNADQADDAVTDDTSQEDDVIVETENEAKDNNEAPGIDSNVTNNDGDLNSIDDVDTLKSMIVQLRACNQEQEDQIAGLEVQVASLEKDNEYLKKELKHQFIETDNEAFSDNTSVNEKHAYSMA